MLLGIVGTGTVIAGWAMITATGLVSERSLPSPTAVATSLPLVLADPDLHAGLADTLLTWLGALALASAVAIVLGVLIGTVPWLARPAMVAVNALRSIPSTALIPLAILLFGLGPAMKGAVAVYAVAPIVLINTIYGVAGTEPMRIDAARSMHWPWWRRWAWLVLPSATPAIVTGIRVASGIALVVVVSAELLGGRSGAGLILVQYQQALRIDMAYACITVIGVVGMALYGLLTLAERRTIARIHLV
ncbi:ABC transporter permease [Occultella aeris]|uniref:ABC transporter permease n=1 Tax=Occultella aeris TaxID=2761496 RepID=UPI0018D3D1D9|nr:ABC transporter permease [Occultella aeris]